ncbi:MAG: hypothetical protein ACR5K4_03065 [Sodalis sp. (in: enterobacteria)]
MALVYRLQDAWLALKPANFRNLPGFFCNVPAQSCNKRVEILGIAKVIFPSLSFNTLSLPD